MTVNKQKKLASCNLQQNVKSYDWKLDRNNTTNTMNATIWSATMYADDVALL